VSEKSLSPRLSAIIETLPLRPGMRVIEIGCGSGAAARAVAQRIGSGHVLAIDRSAKAVAQCRSASAELIAAGKMQVRQASVEKFALEQGEARYDLAFAVRVGALDGRHSHLFADSIRCLQAALKKNGKFFIDGGNPLKKVSLT
jgi:cyclopropane fatty-acyl-phospholipid synthase-like methyltransferase